MLCNIHIVRFKKLHGTELTTKSNELMVKGQLLMKFITSPVRTKIIFNEQFQTSLINAVCTYR